MIFSFTVREREGEREREREEDIWLVLCSQSFKGLCVPCVLSGEREGGLVSWMVMSYKAH